LTVLVVRSGKGGVGRTSLTVLLACALSRRGADVTVMDLDHQDALRLHCGDVEQSQAPLEAGRLQPVATPGGFARVAQDAATCALLMGGGPRAMQTAPTLLAPWLARPEILIVDMPAVEDATAAAVASLAGLHLRPFLPDAGSLAQLSDPTGDLSFPRSLYVLNQADRRRPLSEGAGGFLRHVVGARFAGEIRRDEAVPEAFASLTPLPEYEPSSAAWRDVEVLAAELEIRLAAAARFESSLIPEAPQEARRA
jgi:ATP-binding protein involved in chromosome partitioning